MGFLKAAVLLFGTVAMASVASADVVYVGSWTPYNPSAPIWGGSANGPLAYTGQEAAALLFGGSPSDYYISTVDANVANIDHMAWYDVIGYGGSKFAENYNNKYLGLYYGPTFTYTFGNPNNAASAFIRDNGVSGVNYAFRVTNTPSVPEPSTYAILTAGAGAALLLKRRNRSNVN